MATPQLNLTITAGTSFSQSFAIGNPDQSSVDLSGHTVTARMAKHPGAYNALTSVSGAPVFKYTEFTSTIANANTGQCVISLTAAETALLSEGKYSYSVLLDDGMGTISEIIHGMVFVRPSIGFGTTLGA